MCAPGGVPSSSMWLRSEAKCSRYRAAGTNLNFLHARAPKSGVLHLCSKYLQSVPDTEQQGPV